MMVEDVEREDEQLEPSIVAHAVPRLRSVLIIPPGHAETLRDRRRLTRREIWMVGGVLGAVAVLAVVLVISFASSGPEFEVRLHLRDDPRGDRARSRSRQCGGAARDRRAHRRRRPGAFTAQAAKVIAAECRKAGLPVGSS